MKEGYRDHSNISSLYTKQGKAWEDLHRLSKDEDSGVRSSSIATIGSVFSLIPDKEQAWQDLHRRLDQDEGHMGQKVGDRVDHRIHEIGILQAEVVLHAIGVRIMQADQSRKKTEGAD